MTDDSVARRAVNCKLKLISACVNLEGDTCCQIETKPTSAVSFRGRVSKRYIISCELYHNN